MRATTLKGLSSVAQAESRSTVEETIRKAVQLVLWKSRPPRMYCERRRERRHPFPFPIRLTPVGGDGVTPIGKDIVVLGKHLSEHGLDFYHHEPVPDRRMLATFEFGEGVCVRLLMELTWCRFGCHGWYENGGRFLQPVPPPIKTQLPLLGEASLRLADRGASVARERNGASRRWRAE